jgi:(p)ppGpp synthase/HD superfamily hydrolase
MTGVVAKALDFATKAHGDQVRKYTGEPYTNHLVEVMNIVRTVKSDDSMLAAALLHDTIEDTSVTEADVQREFGFRIAKLVVELTDISKPEDGNRAFRKAMDRDKLAKVSDDAQTIKLADLISNGKDIAVNDPNFAKVFLNEKRQLLEVLDRGDSVLMKQAKDILDTYFMVDA